MDYLHYQYGLSDFVVANDYRTEYFTIGNDNNLNTERHYALARIVNQTHIERDKLEGLIKRIYVPERELNKYCDGENEFYSYNPLSDTPELYLEMNKIKIFNEESLMKFINNYGIPLDKEVEEDGNGQYMLPTNLFRKNETKKFLMGMDVLTFYEELLMLQNALMMWNNLIENDIEEMKKVKSHFEDRAKVLAINPGEEPSVEEQAFLEAKKKSSELIMTWEEMKNTDLERIVKAYLYLKLKEIKSGETDGRLIDNKIVPAIKFNNLMEVAGYQLKQAIFKEQKLERCLNCEALFEPIHASQKFCSPLPGRKRSTCENTYNQRQKRLRKKQKLEGDK